MKKIVINNININNINSNINTNISILDDVEIIYNKKKFENSNNYKWILY